MWRSVRTAHSNHLSLILTMPPPIVLTNPRTGLATLNFPLMIQRYIRQFQRSDPKEALQYIYCITLNSDSAAFAPGSGKKNVSSGAGVSEEQVGLARGMVRKLVLGCDGKWDELVGAFRDDGTKFVSLSDLSGHFGLRPRLMLICVLPRRSYLSPESLSASSLSYASAPWPSITSTSSSQPPTSANNHTSCSMPSSSTISPAHTRQ